METMRALLRERVAMLQWGGNGAPKKPAESAGLAIAGARIAPKHREFLPATLEILDTPPSPVAIALLVFICALFAAGLAWSYFGWLDIHAVAQGKIQPSGRSKVIQPLEPGKVVAVWVENGSRVEAADVLLELDPTETLADRLAQARDLEASNAEIARRQVAIRLAREEAGTTPTIAFAAGMDESVRLREQNVLAADLAQLQSARESLRAQLGERQAQKRRLLMSMTAREQLLKILRERVDMRESVDAKGHGYRAKVIDALQELERELTNLASEKGQLAETDAAVLSLERKLEEATANFIADNTQKGAEAERKRDRLAQELVKAQSKNDRTRLRAPIAGTVQQLSVTTVGQVVGSGQPLMTIVPLDAPIEVEALIFNKDIGFVEPGQPAVVKVEAFPFTRYGTLEGIVAKVSRDAVDERDATNLGDAAAVTRPQGAPAATMPGARTQSLVFPATVTLSRGSMAIDGKEVPLSPGMAVTVEIKTGQRRAIDYLLSPVREVVSQTARER
jgi:hemolysin D